MGGSSTYCGPRCGLAHESVWRAPVIAPGDICLDSSGAVIPTSWLSGFQHVAVLSNSSHLSLNTDWVITCPFIPDTYDESFRMPDALAPTLGTDVRGLMHRVRDDAATSTGVIRIGAYPSQDQRWRPPCEPAGYLLPELVQCVRTSGLGEPIGNVGADAPPRSRRYRDRADHLTTRAE